MMRWLFILSLATLVGCGLAEDDQDDKNKRIYVTFSDPRFEAYCLSEFDLNHDGRISHNEAQRVFTISCPNLEIGQLGGIEEFTNLRELDCYGNVLLTLDVRKCTDLRTLNCAHNQLNDLKINGLRSMTTLLCYNNRLTQLDLKSSASLRTLDCRYNQLVTLDVAACSSELKADVRENELLTTVYCLQSQSAGINYNGPTQLSVR